MLKYKVRPHKQPTSILSDPAVTPESGAGPAHLHMQRGGAQACGQRQGLLGERESTGSPRIPRASSVTRESVHPKVGDALTSVRYISKKSKN